MKQPKSKQTMNSSSSSSPSSPSISPLNPPPHPSKIAPADDPLTRILSHLDDLDQRVDQLARSASLASRTSSSRPSDQAWRQKLVDQRDPLAAHSHQLASDLSSLQDAFLPLILRYQHSISSSSSSSTTPPSLTLFVASFINQHDSLLRDWSSLANSLILLQQELAAANAIILSLNINKEPIESSFSHSQSPVPLPTPTHLHPPPPPNTPAPNTPSSLSPLPPPLPNTASPLTPPSPLNTHTPTHSHYTAGIVATPRRILGTPRTAAAAQAISAGLLPPNPLSPHHEEPPPPPSH